MPPNRFPPEVERELKTYVYRLIDPRDGATFYVGMGEGNRVFAHVRDELGLEADPESNKLKIIREIRNTGLAVGHVIHRHGMDRATALQVEAALMDAYPGLTNVAGGVGTNAYGVAHADEIIRRYQAEEAIFDDKALLINVSRSAEERPLYEATRFAWKLDRRKAEQADVVLATQRGVIIGAFVADEWLDATAENFPGREDAPGRLGFEGGEAPSEIRRRYVGKRVPEKYRKRGSANPIRYTWRA